MKKYAIIVAGGKGTRMNVATPKQFLILGGKPILAHTIERFLEIPDIQIILTLPHEHHNTWKKIREEYFSDADVKSVTGGDARTDSVRAGLESIDDEGLVAIHDGVRPFVSKEIIERSFKSAEEFGSGVAAVQLKDSIREIVSDSSEARNRDNYVSVQTPQTFRISKIKEAYSRIVKSFSDDATVYEKAGFQVRLVEGAYSNMKITTPEDLE